MQIRVTPSFVVAVLALLVAAGGTGYAAGKVTSSQIKDETIKSRDIRNGTITGTDLQDGSLTGKELGRASVPRDRLDPKCGAGLVPLFDGCTTRAAIKYSDTCGADDAPYGACFFDAVADCDRRRGRLPTILELAYIARSDRFIWSFDDNPSQYEFSGEYTTDYPHTPIGVDQAGASVENAIYQIFAHRCITH